MSNNKETATNSARTSETFSKHGSGGTNASKHSGTNSGKIIPPIKKPSK